LKLFVDTWGWLVLADRRDPFNAQASRCYKECSESSGRVFTSNFVLDETFTLLFSRLSFEEARRFANGILDSPFIAVEQVTEPRFRRAFELRVKFSDKPKISFTDLSSMVIMTELKLTDVLTADAHFSQVGFGFRVFSDGTGE
jgi:uncharacterized protein